MVTPLKYFQEISSIPRGSKFEGAIADYLVDFAETHGLVCHRDNIHNVIIKKPGSRGLKNRPPVMLQGHTDMVCEQNVGTDHNFSEDGINLVFNGNKLSARGTTLGADNGVAVAYMLALLESSVLPHPPLECVFTVQEEIGLIGAEKLDGSLLTSRTLINIDGGPFGTAIISCAGGMRVYLSKEIVPSKPVGAYALDISARGLFGGHSGIDIGLDRGNANKLMGRILHNVLLSHKAELSYIKGGAKDNAIPRECDSTLIFTSKADRSSAMDLIGKISDSIEIEYHDADPDVKITSTIPKQTPQTSFGYKATSDLVSAIYLAPNGVKFRSPASGGFIVSSVNLGVIDSTGSAVALTFSPRSSISSLQTEALTELKLLARTFGFNLEHGSEYPGWSYATESPLRDTFTKTFRDLFNTDLKTEAIHAGLECGLFSAKLPGLDAIAIGPDVHNPHTPDEWLDIDSFEKIWMLLVEVLSRL